MAGKATPQRRKESEPTTLRVSQNDSEMERELEANYLRHGGNLAPTACSCVGNVWTECGCEGGIQRIAEATCDGMCSTRRGC